MIHTAEELKKIKQTILIVEDNDINRDILKSILEDNYIVIEATNGQEGLDILKEKKNEISLILLDIQMPVMDGYEFLSHMDDDKSFKQIPIIVTTSDPTEEENSLIRGASDFVRKPYKPNIILRRVEALIRLKLSINALNETRFDKTTGLLNREVFHYVSDNLLQNNLESNYTYFLMQIKNLSFINTTYGEKDANKLIEIIGNILKHYESKSFAISRYGGDNFAFVVDSSLPYKMAVRLIERQLQQKTNIQKVGLKFAIYENVDKNLTTHIIINRLFTAIKTLPNDSENNVVLFDESMLEIEKKKHTIYSCMEDSLKNEDFKVFIQPKHDCLSGKLVGGEALIRWIHPTLGFISPADFVPALEEHGFITKIDIYVLEKTCAILKHIKELGLTPCPISINLSRRDLALFNDLTLIKNILDKYDINADLIHFEITESVCGDGKEVFEKAKILRDAGFKIEIDDFGSGYSCLGMISDIPMDYLKLDMTFAKHIDTQQNIIKYVIALAHDMGAKVIAEGVETQEQKEIYTSLGCDYIQGYFYSKPLNEADFISYLN